MKIKILYLLVFIANLTYSQEEVPFSIRFQEYVQGDLTFIANNIVNRNDRKNANESYDKVNNYSKLNDEFEMSYIDIDNDKTTYSSSSASYFSTKKTNEIIFVGLYWSATYKYPVGYNDNDNFSGDGERESNINEIKIKTPSDEKYQDIKGEIIFDGFQVKKHKNNSPYVCFYDLTNKIKENPYGEYTVANIKSTQGHLEGGVAGGWIIYFVYGDTESTKKYISLYDGFSFVYNTPIKIKLSHFLAPKTGNINSKIALCALEGDLKIEGDNVRIKNSQNNKYFPVFSKSRDVNNLFNSQISIGNEHFIDRNPSSLNTLGFDALLLSLDNRKNEIISNNATETELKIASNGDKVYLFSAGFTVDVDEKFYEESKRKPVTEKPVQPIVQTEISEKAEEVKTNDAKKKVKKENDNDLKITLKNISFINENEKSDVYENNGKQKFLKKSLKNKENSRQYQEIRKLEIENSLLESGYYLVANVFEFTRNAKKYELFLKNNTITSNSFLNPKNNYTYVYLKFFTTLKEAQEAFDSNLKNTFFDNYWIMEVSKPEK
jgi:hypothetical protein